MMAATKQAGNVQMVMALLDAGAPPNAVLYPASHAFTDADAEAWEREGGEHRGNAEGEDAAIDGQAAASKVGAGAGSGAGSGAVGGAGGVGRGKTALHFACEAGGTIDVAAALLQHGAEAEVPDDVGVTPLMVAAGLGHVELVQLLLQAGANVDAKQSGGATALMLAVKCNKPEVLWVLLEAGAEHATHDSWALQTAKENGLDQCEVLLMAAAEIDARDARAAAAAAAGGGEGEGGGGGGGGRGVDDNAADSDSNGNGNA